MNATSRQSVGAWPSLSIDFLFPNRKHGGSEVISPSLTRDNGTPVPVIPVDELPSNINLQGVPRSMTPEQTLDLQYLGELPFTGLQFQQQNLQSHPVQHSAEGYDRAGDLSSIFATSAATSKYLSSMESLARPVMMGNSTTATSFGNSITSNPSSLHKRPASYSSIPEGSWRQNAIHLRSSSNTSSNADKPRSRDSSSAQALIDSAIRTPAGQEMAARLGYRTPSPQFTPSGIIPDQEKKEYCTFWIRKGECDYMQQGCKYKHEMPSREILRGLIGTDQYPRWWVEKTAPIKLGSMVRTVAAKPETWLGKKSGKEGLSDDDSCKSDSDAEADDEGEDATVSESSKNAGKKPSMKRSALAKMARKDRAFEMMLHGSAVDEQISKVVAKHATGGDKKPVAKPINDSTAEKKRQDPLVQKGAQNSSSTTPVSLKPATREMTPKEPKTRKPSFTGDLIDFAPLIPTPASATPTPPASAKEAPPPPTQKSTPLTSPPAKAPTTTNASTKVFVPAGESADKHIADAKKRLRRAAHGQAHRTSSISPQLGAQEAPKRTASGGLLDSKHAPATGEKDGPPKPTCRPRRPAVGSKAMAANVGSEKEGEKKKKKGKTD